SLDIVERSAFVEQDDYNCFTQEGRAFLYKRKSSSAKYRWIKMPLSSVTAILGNGKCGFERTGLLHLHRSASDKYIPATCF
ncbi:MAG: hypothetical protein LBR91_00305, partial [Puniceicoccales bacterium]|nr:hypothetical protein [Puniceicoccales bacterium]